MSPQNVICIAGAHRSGTSMLTRLLHVLGLALGPEIDLMPAAADNPEGFWENLRFVQLNDEILNAVGGAWDLPPWEDELFRNDDLAPVREKATLLLESFAPEPLWGWKDPRTCLTLPFWRDLLPPFKTVIMVRNPLEVAYSMNRRNATSYALALRLWEIYHRRLLNYTSEDERLVTSYQTFFEEPEIELTRIANFCQLPRERTAAAAKLVTSTRRHTTFNIEQLIDAGVRGEILRLYKLLLAEAAEREAGFKEQFESAPKEISTGLAAPKTHQLAGEATRLNFTIPETETVQRDAATQREFQEKLEALRQELAGQQNKSRENLEALRQELAGQQTRAVLEIGRRDGRITELQNAYSHLDELLLREQAGRNKLLEELNHARDRFNQTNRLLHSQSVQLAERETEAFSLTERLRKQLLANKRLLKLLDETARAGELLRRSRRWILINPFSWLSSRISKRPLRGFGHLDRVIGKYRSWQSDHPEIKDVENTIAVLRSRHLHVASPSPSLPADFVVSKSELKPAPPTKPIEFAIQKDPEVSIIIPVYNQLDFTLSCLASLQEHAGDIPFEVIVVDDCSADATEQTLSKIPGLIYQRKEKNSGFIASCNLGAERARGRYLVFLNNDTTVTPGWLAALRETFDFEPQAGLVGSKLVYPDGRLQEAGGIIWRDASGWNRGKFQDAGRPEYNCLRKVDYCSAASVMISKRLFLTVGGFDSRYAPAYYEDTDLAFKVTASGFEVLYQPLSVVIHYEGITGGTDLSSGTKRYQEVNRTTFRTRWSDTLAQKPENDDIEGWDLPAPPSRRILVIDHHVPFADRDSGSLRMFHILTLLHELGHRVTFIPHNLADIPPYGDNLRRRGIEFVHHPYLNSIREYLETNGQKFDVVILSRRDFACDHIDHVRSYAPQARVIFDTVDLHFLREEREAELMCDAELSAKTEMNRLLEYDLIDKADETWVVSPVEEEILRRERPAKSVQIISNIVPVTDHVPPFSSRRDILFIGSFQHTPNIDAALFFGREILPWIRRQLPELRCYIIGDKAPSEVIALADENVILTGYQPDVRSYFSSIRLSVAPLRYGAGVKGKVNQSMGFGVPVVATTIAAEGMSLTDHQDVMIADGPEAFADAVIELYNSESLWDTISNNALAKTRAFFSLEAARKQLAQLSAEHPSRSQRSIGIEP
jgi:GT2 family glycosyltransferase/glycosyltransferase involved in cell wall biosynthesis